LETEALGERGKKLGTPPPWPRGVPTVRRLGEPVRGYILGTRVDFPMERSLLVMGDLRLYSLKEAVEGACKVLTATSDPVAP
jgi:hypothetical protein